MKCPFRKIVIHKPEVHDGYYKRYAQDIEEYPDCYEDECPFYEWKSKCKRSKDER